MLLILKNAITHFDIEDVCFETHICKRQILNNLKHRGGSFYRCVSNQTK